MDKFFCFAYLNSIATGKNDLGNLEEESLDASDEEKQKKSSKVHKTSGRKSPWSQQQLDDFIDIIVQDEEYKKKLIFRNTKFQRNGELYEKIKLELKQRCVIRNENMTFTVEQLRSKFKKCVGECQRVAQLFKQQLELKDSWMKKLWYMV